VVCSSVAPPHFHRNQPRAWAVSPQRPFGPRDRQALGYWQGCCPSRSWSSVPAARSRRVSRKSPGRSWRLRCRSPRSTDGRAVPWSRLATLEIRDSAQHRRLPESIVPEKSRALAASGLVTLENLLTVSESGACRRTRACRPIALMVYRNRRGRFRSVSNRSGRSRGESCLSHSRV